MCSIMEMGVDRILFSVDYPFVPIRRERNGWRTCLSLSRTAPRFLSGNTKRLLRM